MNINLGTLQFFPAKEHPELLAKPVFDSLSKISDAGTVRVTEINPSFSDTATFCEYYKIEMHQAANCVVLEAKRADRTWLAACVILGSARADINGLARRTLDARRVSFAPMEKAVLETGMEYGAITPVGLPGGWPILLDKAVAESDYIVIGSGIRKSKLAVPGAFLVSLPNAQVVEGLAR